MAAALTEQPRSALFTIPRRHNLPYRPLFPHPPRSLPSPPSHPAPPPPLPPPKDNLTIISTILTPLRNSASLSKDKLLGIRLGYSVQVHRKPENGSSHTEKRAGKGGGGWMKKKRCKSTHPEREQKFTIAKIHHRPRRRRVLEMSFRKRPVFMYENPPEA